MPVTRANYDLPKRDNDSSKNKDPKKSKRAKFEENQIKKLGAKGSFMIFKEDGLEDVFVVEDF